ncbi:hypothetical protein [Sphingomonas sp.]|uniref:hypothetical protein n=1 Tax=Sphingomonas sp. TaxID=28214 RepID=UPI0028A111D6|nr:hypothetical protein [Sphingomonas sp.]
MALMPGEARIVAGFRSSNGGIGGALVTARLTGMDRGSATGPVRHVIVVTPVLRTGRRRCHQRTAGQG